ncbi:hypothetical protein K501DRAFT_266471 [Backusella circina FSU 941]|nr:hypothetical protein K501DRAFT_266471 [Backusella circina FSU 941]
MHFSVISAIFFFLAISANAASLSKRDTSTYLSDLGTAETGINTLTTYVNGISTSTDALNSVISVYTYARQLQISIITSQTSYCSLKAPLSSGDATSVLNEECTVASGFASMISAVVTKRAVYDPAAQYEYILKWIFGNLTQSTTPVLDCLTSALPSDSQSTAKGYATTISNALQTLNDEFANVVVPDTMVYPDTQTCIDAINPISDTFKITFGTIYAFSSTSTASDFNIIQSQLVNEQSLSQTAATSCCADSTNQMLDCLSKLNPSDHIDEYLKDIPNSIQETNEIFANATQS